VKGLTDTNTDLFLLLWTNSYHNIFMSDLQSKEYFVRVLAILDRRCGKHLLLKTYEKQDLNNMSGWL